MLLLVIHDGLPVIECFRSWQPVWLFVTNKTQKSNTENGRGGSAADRQRVSVFDRGKKILFKFEFFL